MATLRRPVTVEDHAEGPSEAAVTLVEYGDYECPHCGRAYPIVKAVQKHFGKRLRFVFRNFPLTEAHPHAESAAEAAEAAGAQGKFWPMHDGLFEHQQRLGAPLYSSLAAALHLDEAGFVDALETGAYRARVRADFSSGVRSGVNGTPTFFVNGTRHDGPFDFETLVRAIDHAMEQARG